MHIGKDYYVEADSQCVTLYRKRIRPEFDKRGNPNKDSGKEYKDIIGYYPCIASAFARVVELEVNGVDELEEIGARILELRKWAMEILGWKDKFWIKQANR